MYIIYQKKIQFTLKLGTSIPESPIWSCKKFIYHPAANNLCPKQTSVAEYSKNFPTDEVYETDNVNSIFVCASSQKYHGQRFTMLERAYCNDVGHPEQM